MALGPAYGSGDVTVNNPSGVIYVGGNDLLPESWRFEVNGGEHPFDVMAVQHRETLEEENIDLNDAKVIEIEALTGFNDLVHYYASVATDTRTVFSTPPALPESMAGRIIAWDGNLWTFTEDEWVTKSTFENSLHTDRAVMQRMQIINTDPDDGLAYPPIPEIGGGIVLGARTFDFEGTQGAHLSFTQSDGLQGMFAFMIQQDISGIDASPDNLVVIRGESGLGPGVSTIEYQDNHTDTVDYRIGDQVTVSGIAYLSATDGLQDPDFFGPENVGKWIPQDRDLLLGAAMIDLNGDVMVDASGRILRSLAQ